MSDILNLSGLSDDTLCEFGAWCHTQLNPATKVSAETTIEQPWLEWAVQIAADTWADMEEQRADAVAATLSGAEARRVVRADQRAKLNELRCRHAV